MSRCEVYRLLWTFEHIVRKPAHTMGYHNEVQDARAITLIQEGRTFGHFAVDLKVIPSVIHRLWNHYNATVQFTRRVGQGHGCMTTPQDDRYLTSCALRHHSATTRELQTEAVYFALISK